MIIRYKKPNPKGSLFKLYLFLFILFMSQATSVIAQTYPGKIGVGVEIGGWNLPFVDAARTARSYTKPDGTAVPKDSKGWPMGDAQTVLMDMRPVAEWSAVLDDPEQFRLDVSGTYKCSFNGQATLVKVEGPFTIGPATYNASTNTTTFDLTIDPPGPHHGLVILQFLNTKRTASSASNTGFTNFKAIRPGYSANTTQLFTNEFLNGITNAGFSTIRTMGGTHTNNSNPFYPGVTEWASRKTLDAATWDDDNIGQEKGKPWEIIVDLANAVDVDLWINVPVAATDNYITQLATFLKNRLEPERKLYVEYSNEVWNWGFTQSVWSNQKAESQGLNYIKGYSKRTVEMAILFQNVFGAGSLNNKVRVINAWQIGWNPPEAQYEEQMNYINATFGPPKNYIYGLGVAPYANCGNACETGTVQEILDAMRASSDQSKLARQKIVTVATNWQIPGGMVSYEGGTDTGGGSATNIANKIGAERAAEMKNILLRDLRENWFEIGGGLFVYLELSSSYNRYGSWGLTDDIRNLDRNFKYSAARELIGSGVTTAPPAPAGLTATAGNATVTLNWSSASNAASYKVKRSTTNGGTYTTVGTPATTSYSDNTVTNGTTYYYVVSAVNAVGESANSSQVSALPTSVSTTTVVREYWSNISGTAVSAIPVTTAPTGTSNLSALEGPANFGDNYGTRIRAFITPTSTGNYTFYVAGDDDCELWLSTNDSPANKAKIASVTGWTNVKEWTKYATQKSTAISLNAGTKYYVEVLHKEGAGGDHVAVGWTGPGISAITVIGNPYLSPYSAQPPSPPTGLTANGGNATVSLTWTAVSGATGYNIKRHTGGNFNNIATGVTSASYQDNTVVNGTTYFYAVTAVNANGESNVSNTAQVTPATTSASVTREYWTGITGTTVSSIPLTTTPSGSDQLSSLEGPLNWGDNYGARIRAFLKPSTSGSYTFYISGDDNCELWLSTDSNPANKVKIAEVTGWTSSRQWTKEPSQQSTARTLTANTNYYIEILHKEANGGDNVAAAWTGPGISAITVIGGGNISAYTTPPATTKLEAESAALSGGAGINTNHTGYSGTGFVDGYWTQGATTTFTYNASSAGAHNIKLRYANGSGSSKTLSVYVNNVKIRQTSLINLASWSTWGDKVEALTLTAGNNTVAYKYDAGDGGNVNLDFIEVTSGASASASGRMASGTENEFILETGEKEVSVYPNPANNIMHVNLYSEDKKQANIQLVDYVGVVQIAEQHKLQKGNNKITINTSSLIGGLYFLKVRTGQESVMKKILIIR